MTIVEKVKDAFQDVADTAIDGIEKVSGPASRAGAVVNRVGAMSAGGVKNKVIAVQMTENSPNGHQYSEGFVKELVHLAHDSETKVVVTKAEATALIKDQKSLGHQNSDEDLKDLNTISPIAFQS